MINERVFLEIIHVQTSIPVQINQTSNKSNSTVMQIRRRFTTTMHQTMGMDSNVEVAEDLSFGQAAVVVAKQVFHKILDTTYQTTVMKVTQTALIKTGEIQT